MTVSGLYAITDPALMPGPLLIDKVDAALQGGCRLVQYRNKNAPDSQRLDDAKRLRDLCRQYHAQLIINDDLPLALAVDAAGVHLGQDDLDLAEARHQVTENFILGTTCHASLAFAANGQQKGANYLAFGRFFPSQTKAAAPPAQPDIIRQAKQAFALPVVAIGGVTVDNAAILIDHGADAVAVCHDLFQHQNLQAIRQKAQQYTRLFNSQG